MRCWPFGDAMVHGFFMNGQADLVLGGALAALADGSAIGGCTSGVDLMTWDGTPCGYEGILTNQFGVVAAAVERYGAGPR